MLASVRALLSGIIDYAGMFPPAKLPLDEAIRNYARYRTEPESWMLGRFVCPAARLGELAPYLEELFLAGPPLTISALGRGGNTQAEFLTGLQEDLQIIGDFRVRHRKVVLDVYEIRLSAEVAEQLEKKMIEAFACLHAQATSILETARSDLEPFYEVPFFQGWRPFLAGFPDAPWSSSRGICQGIKLRCGGVETSAFPSPEQIAGAITCCRERGVLLKATAGLHHPIRRFDPGVQAKMHGFLNVFAAGVLSFANRLSEKEVQAIIEDEDPNNFVFDDEGLRWKTYRAKTTQIESARREFITSFGSCSFDEPRDDLRALELIP